MEPIKNARAHEARTLLAKGEVFVLVSPDLTYCACRFEDPEVVPVGKPTGDYDEALREAERAAR